MGGSFAADHEPDLRGNVSGGFPAIEMLQLEKHIGLELGVNKMIVGWLWSLRESMKSSVAPRSGRASE
jgi:hypothetical protein